MILVAPPASANPNSHADWMEIEALRDSDRRCSREDLVSALRTSGSYEDVDEREPDRDPGSEIMQEIAQSAYDLLESRSEYLGDAYPFTLEGTSIKVKRSSERLVYTFLLLSSNLGGDQGSTNNAYASTFEDVSASAIRLYLGGDANDAQVYQLGHPRRHGQPSGFLDAVTELASKLGEGGTGRHRSNDAHLKDGKLDIVAWIPHTDRREGQVIGFGQCATGKNWKEKITELQPSSFCRLWMTDSPVETPFRLFFVPHVIDSSDWLRVSINSGILFDRLRIAKFSSKLEGLAQGEVIAWNKKALKTLRDGKLANV